MIHARECFCGCYVGIVNGWEWAEDTDPLYAIWRSLRLALGMVEC